MIYCSSSTHDSSLDSRMEIADQNRTSKRVRVIPRCGSRVHKRRKSLSCDSKDMNREAALNGTIAPTVPLSNAGTGF